MVFSPPFVALGRVGNMSPEPRNTVSGMYIHGAPQLKCSQFLANLFRAKRGAKGAMPREVYNFVTRMVLATCKVGRLIYTCILVYTAISRKVVGKSACDNPERHCGGFEFTGFQRNLKELARKAMKMCLRVLTESNKSRFDSYSRQE